MGLCGHFSFILSLRETERRKSGVFIKSLVHLQKTSDNFSVKQFLFLVKKGLNAEFLDAVSDLEGSFVAGDYFKARSSPR
jgi:hypothetical protein